MLLQVASPAAIVANVQDRIIGFLLTMCIAWIEARG